LVFWFLASVKENIDQFKVNEKYVWILQPQVAIKVAQPNQQQLTSMGKPKKGR
jgi:hypothetical protein